LSDLKICRSLFAAAKLSPLPAASSYTALHLVLSYWRHLLPRSRQSRAIDTCRPMASKGKGKAPAALPTETHWLMKAEPESRMEKGKDVAFSVDIFEQVRLPCCLGRVIASVARLAPLNGTACVLWGLKLWCRGRCQVRNPQAKNFMKHAMKIGHKVLFYHS
jgi:hypothetical protein